MRRGEIWTVAGGKDYAGKPSPAVITQDDAFDATDSITICAFTTDKTDAPSFRLLMQPSAHNGLRTDCPMMFDKITTVPKCRLGAPVGSLEAADMLRITRQCWYSLGWRDQHAPTAADVNQDSHHGKTRNLVSPVGLEPTTTRLKVQCSTN